MTREQLRRAWSRHFQDLETRFLDTFVVRAAVHDWTSGVLRLVQALDLPRDEGDKVVDVLNAIRETRAITSKQKAELILAFEPYAERIEP